MTEWVEVFVRFLEGLVVIYSCAYVSINVGLILLAFRPVLDRVRSQSFEDFDLIGAGDSSLPPIAIVVSAYDEALTIVESIRSLMAVDYPAIELIVTNDGSRDDTARVVRQAFRMRRRDLPSRSDLTTAPVRAIYESTAKLPPNVERFVFIDKDNGGRADGLNAGLNLCTSPYFLTVDADCILDPTALKQMTRLLQMDPELVAAGGQVGVVNDCEVEGGRILRAHIPRRFLALCQTVEYLRAFSLLRAGFSRLNALLILSGAFMVLRRDLAVEVGGFLTGRSPSWLVREYVGSGTTTVCEDMEIIVRIHRHAREHSRVAKVAHSPAPLVWTEVPERLGSLSKQRGRWHRGLIEILWYHRRMLLNPRYGRIGVFALPYFLWFELMGPYIEAIGFFVLPLLALTGLLSLSHALLITSIALGAGMIQSLLAVLVSTWMEPSSLTGREMRSLMGADRWSDRLVLLGGSFLTELGYRQLSVWWRLRATWDYLRGHQSWDKFERQGFRQSAAGVILAAALLFPIEPARAELPPGRDLTVVVTSERRDSQPVSWWTESVARFAPEGEMAQWAGAYRADRDGLTDYGLIVGLAPPPWTWGGLGLELRISSGADFTPRWSYAAETEFSLVGKWTGSVKARHAHYSNLDVTRWSVGTVAYLRWNWWWSNHLDLQHSHTSEDRDGDLWGFASVLSTRWPKGVELRWSWEEGGESVFFGGTRPSVDLRARIAGVRAEIPIHASWSLLGGILHREPERGPSNLYMHTGMRRSF